MRKRLKEKREDKRKKKKTGGKSFLDFFRKHVPSFRIASICGSLSESEIEEKSETREESHHKRNQQRHFVEQRPCDKCTCRIRNSRDLKVRAYFYMYRKLRRIISNGKWIHEFHTRMSRVKRRLIHQYQITYQNVKNMP